MWSCGCRQAWHPRPLTVTSEPNHDTALTKPPPQKNKNRYGTCVHSGFGLGFERLILFTTGMENIRDVIPFPRWPGNARG